MDYVLEDISRRRLLLCRCSTISFASVTLRWLIDCYGDMPAARYASFLWYFCFHIFIIYRQYSTTPLSAAISWSIFRADAAGQETYVASPQNLPHYSTHHFRRRCLSSHIISNASLELPSRISYFYSFALDRHNRFDFAGHALCSSLRYCFVVICSELFIIFAIAARVIFALLFQAHLLFSLISILFPFTDFLAFSAHDSSRRHSLLDFSAYALQIWSTRSLGAFRFEEMLSWMAFSDIDRLLRYTNVVVIDIFASAVYQLENTFASVSITADAILLSAFSPVRAAFLVADCAAVWLRMFFRWAFASLPFLSFLALLTARICLRDHLSLPCMIASPRIFWFGRAFWLLIFVADVSHDTLSPIADASCSRADIFRRFFSILQAYRFIRAFRFFFITPPGCDFSASREICRHYIFHYFQIGFAFRLQSQTAYSGAWQLDNTLHISTRTAFISDFSRIGCFSPCWWCFSLPHQSHAALSAYYLYFRPDRFPAHHLIFFYLAVIKWASSNFLYRVYDVTIRYSASLL